MKNLVNVLVSISFKQKRCKKFTLTHHRAHAIFLIFAFILHRTLLEIRDIINFPRILDGISIEVVFLCSKNVYKRSLSFSYGPLNPFVYSIFSGKILSRALWNYYQNIKLFVCLQRYSKYYSSWDSKLVQYIIK